MSMRLASIFVLFLIAAAATPGVSQDTPATAAGVTFFVNDPAKRNQITFKSEAALEDIIGMSNDITGKIVFDPAKPEEGGSGTFAVPAASFTTGIPLRDEHLDGAPWLNAAEFPEIKLEITKINKISTVSRSDKTASFAADVAAKLTIRGKTNPVSFVARLTYLKEDELTKNKMPGDLLGIRAEFAVNLAAYGIKGPEGKGIVGSKVSEDVMISVNLFASNSPEMALAPSEGK
jgi:polyisoprenoid-binding protein YceI